MHILGQRIRYRPPNRPSLNLCKSWLPIFAGKLDFGHVGATSATDWPMTFVYRGCQKGVDVALIRPAEYDCHARDLSALVDLVSHDCAEVGAGRKQRVEVGHHVVLPDEGMGPVEASESQLLPTTWPLLLMPVAMPPKSPGRRPRVVSVSFCQSAPYWVVPSALPTDPTIWSSVVNAVGESASSEVLKRGESAVFPRCGVNRRYRRRFPSSLRLGLDR